jgi:cytochrome oxidase assembly protein ShyY1
MKLLAKTWLRWTAWSLLAIIFAASCVVLANWQLDRRDQAVSKIQRMVQNYDRQAISFSVLSELDLEQVTPFEWSPVELSGRYLSDQELLVRNRPIAGQPGFLQLVPFELNSGQIVIIERGWIPADSNLAPAVDMTPSGAAKQITARVRLGELTPNRESPAGFATSIHLESLASLSGLELEQEFYLRLISETPGETQTPQPLGKPLLDEGNHLSYAVQWIMFALMGFFALFWAIRQEREYRRIEKDPTYVPKSARKKKITDGDIEDQLLDASSKK